MTKASEFLMNQVKGPAPKLGLILGSGWSGVLDIIENQQVVPYDSLPDFPKPTVQGHKSQVVIGQLGKHQVAVLTGRKHTYETGDASAMKEPIFTLADWGCEVLIQTNAAGSVDRTIRPGDLLCIADHINYPQQTPLTFETSNQRFVSMIDAYDPELRSQALSLSSKNGISLREGTYGWFTGPQFETPAEIQMAIRTGATVIGMSTVPETILARYRKMKVLAFSFITNMAAGLSDVILSHEHTLSQGQEAASKNAQFLANVVGQLKI